MKCPTHPDDTLVTIQRSSVEIDRCQRRCGSLRREHVEG